VTQHGTFSVYLDTLTPQARRQLVEQLVGGLALDPVGHGGEAFDGGVLQSIGHNRSPLLDDDQQLSMTVKTATRITGFSKDCIYNLLAAGEIKGFLMGSRRFIWAASLRAYISRRAAEPLTIRRSPKPRHGRGVGPADPPTA